MNQTTLAHTIAALSTANLQPDSMDNENLIGYVIDNPDSTAMELELVQRLDNALAEIDLLMRDLATAGHPAAVAQLQH